jgi:hypothetical protein
MRIQYTTYDARHEQDVIHIDTPQCNIMLLNPVKPSGSAHPYVYGRVVGIFHGMVSYVGRLPDGSISYTSHRLDFCWAHWYEFNKAMHDFALERVSPYPFNSPKALNFFDPADILRAVHLVPQFSLKRMDTGLPAKTRWGSKQPLWSTYFINRYVPESVNHDLSPGVTRCRFADRDLFMRYQYGMSVGHKYMYDPTVEFPSMNIPSIPANFDHCMPDPGLDPPEGAATIAPSITRQPQEAGCISNVTGPSMNTPPTTNPLSGLALTSFTAPWELARASPAAGPRWGDVAGEAMAIGVDSRAEENQPEYRWEDDDQEEDDLSAEPTHYDDDLGDEELFLHDEMYGTQIDDYYYY